MVYSESVLSKLLGAHDAFGIRAGESYLSARAVHRAHPTGGHCKHMGSHPKHWRTIAAWIVRDLFNSQHVWDLLCALGQYTFYHTSHGGLER